MHPDEIFQISPSIRYVATYVNGRLRTKQRSNLLNASTPESDRYEEILVNPTLLTLATQRGELDCGGLEYLIVRYGNFAQFIRSLPHGHLSVGIDIGADIFDIAHKLQAFQVDDGTKCRDFV